MILTDLLRYDDIVIQCHNFPDADTIASGYALYCYFTKHSKKARLIYGGAKEITKPNLIIMKEKLDIPIEYVNSLDHIPQLLVTADCVHGESNTADFEAESYAAIDHHASAQSSSPLFYIRPSYGSCSSIMAVLLKEAGYDYNENENLATALYYGLYTDTNEMRELSFPADRDLRDFAVYNKPLLALLVNSNMSLEELRIASDALSNVYFSSKHRYALACAEKCDPNILGFINDLIIKVDSIDASVVCCPASGGIKFSVRSCLKDIYAPELAEFIAENIGSGGGHADKAGGFINLKLAEQAGADISAEDPAPYIDRRIADYYDSTEILYAESYTPDVSGMELYKKNRVTMGYARSTDIYPEGTPFCVRSIEGDLNVEADEKVYIMINDEGSVYPISKEKFDRTYSLTDEPFEPSCEYEPSVFSKALGHKGLLSYARSCAANVSSKIYAKKLTRRVKLYTLWDRENYMTGRIGDYLAVRTDDRKDMYIITEKQFYKTYAKENADE